MSITWHADHGLNTVTATERTGKAPTHERTWSLSTDKEAAFHRRNPRHAIAELADSAELVVQLTPHNEHPITAVFEMAGLKELLPQLLEPCTPTSVREPTTRDGASQRAR